MKTVLPSHTRTSNNGKLMPENASPVVTIAVPSFNQGRFLDRALESIFEQNIPVEVFVMDGGSRDNSVQVIKKWEHKLSWWRSHTDLGQAAAINEAIALGKAPFVCWLNSDDWLEPNGLQQLLEALESAPAAPAAYGKVWDVSDATEVRTPVWTEPFDRKRLALRCIISQPATLIRREAWESVGGTDPSLHMAMDYDLWWRLFDRFGSFVYVKKFVAVNRIHQETKTSQFRRRHYREAIAVIKKYNRSVPLKWWIAQPYAVWYKSAVHMFKGPRLLEAKSNESSRARNEKFDQD